MANYAIELTSAAAKQLKKDVPSQLIPNVATVITSLAAEPFPAGCKKLQYSKRSVWRIRIGDYRVLYELDTEQGKIRILRIAHRSTAYR